MLAAASTALGVYVIDFAKREAHLLPTARTAPVYGISWFPGSDRLCLGFAKSVPPANGEEDLEWYARSEIGFVSDGDWTSAKCLSHVHQVMCASDGRIVCANTGRNCVTILDPAKPGHFQEWQLTERRWDRESNRDNSGDHLNSVYERDGELWVLAHRFNRGSRVARLEYPSLKTIEEFDVPFHTAMHNVWLDDDGRCLGLGSNSGAVVDARTGSTEFVSPVPGYARGLARTNDRYLIGISPKARRSDRGASDAHIVVAGRPDGRIASVVTLQGAGNVREVRVLDQPDRAHHGMPLQRPRALLELASPAEARFDTIETTRQAAPSAAGFMPAGLAEPTIAPDGGLQADEGQLCVLMSEDEHADAIAMRYTIPAGRHGHASLGFVIGTHVFQDQGMILMLVAAEPTGPAAASIWRRADGDPDWLRLEACEGAATLPREGVLTATRRSDGAWQFAVDGHAIRIRVRELSSACGRPVLRWLGATIRVLPERGVAKP